MVKFSEFSYSWTYQVAASTRERIFGEDSLVDVRDFFQPDSEFQAKAFSPSRETFLHILIRHCLQEDVSYCIRKSDSAEYASREIAPLLRAYHIPFPKIAKSKSPGKEHDDKGYLWACRLEGIFVEKAVPRLTQEVFTVMFSDREALKELNGHVAKLIKGLKVADYPNLLKADGKVARCSSWPSWLRKGLFYRDKGRCAICLSNLSGIDAAGTDVAIDHLVPLNLGGTNDPTNLQILCRDCNGKKGGSQATTSSFQHLYWETFNSAK